MRSIGLWVFGSAVLAATLALASVRLGEVGAAQGPAQLVGPGGAADLAPGQPLHAGDEVLTGPNALALLMLNPQTQLHLGPDTRLRLDPALADIGGTLHLAGAMVFDRPSGAPAVPIVIDTAFGEIGVRGTRLFVGPSQGAYAVFVDRGQVSVTSAGVTVTLAAGQGTELAEGQPPGAPQAWGAPRIAAALASVGLDR